MTKSADVGVATQTISPRGTVAWMPPQNERMSSRTKKGPQGANVFVLADGF